MKIGDVVYLDVLKDNRLSGYNPGPDGTRCEVISFNQKMLDGSQNEYWPTVKFLEGERQDETEIILTLHLSVDNPKDRHAPQRPRNRPG